MIRLNQRSRWCGIVFEMNRTISLGVLFWVLLTLGIASCLLLWSEGIRRAQSSLILFLPSVLVAAGGWVKSRKWLKRLIDGLAILISVGLAGILWFGLSFHRSLQPVREVSRYAEVLSKYRVPEISGRMAHFPEVLPTDASDVEFYHRPGFLQGADEMEVSFRLPKEQIEEMRALYGERATLRLINGDWKTREGGSNNLPIPRFETISRTDGLLGLERFDVFEFGEVYPVENQSEGFYWNHGKSYGVAIEKNGRKIVYWSVAW